MKEIINFLRSRPSLKIRSLEQEVGMPINTLSNLMSEAVDKPFPEKWVEPLIQTLRRYGYGQDELVEVLRDLHDIQNGPPLTADPDEYAAVMVRVIEALEEFEK